jgi:hypothetical protein
MKKHEFKVGDLVRAHPSHRDTIFIGLQDDIGVVVGTEPWGKGRTSSTLLRVHWVVRQTKTLISSKYLHRLVNGESHAS